MYTIQHCQIQVRAFDNSIGKESYIRRLAEQLKINFPLEYNITYGIIKMYI